MHPFRFLAKTGGGPHECNGTLRAQGLTAVKGEPAAMKVLEARGPEVYSKMRFGGLASSNSRPMTGCTRMESQSSPESQNLTQSAVSQNSSTDDVPKATNHRPSYTDSKARMTRISRHLCLCKVQDGVAYTYEELAEYYKGVSAAELPLF